MGEQVERQPAPVPTRRLDSIDLMRGLVMVVMALDHVRDFWHHDSLVARDLHSPAGLDPINPVNLDESNGLLFLTRWVTHFCVPTFVFLAGTGVFLQGSRGKGRLELAGFLLTRGVWLMLIDLTLVKLGWSFNFDYHGTFEGRPAWVFGGGIIWIIGAAMVLLAPLVFLPTSSVAAFGVAAIAFHNLLDSKTAADLHLPKWIWGVLHAGGGEVVRCETFSITFGAGYGLLPCLGIMAAGYGFGALYLLEPRVRRWQILGLGLMVTALFVVLRFSNLYGDPTPPAPSLPEPWPALLGTSAGSAGIGAYLPKQSLPGPWSVRDTWDFTVYSFLNCHKYPASLMYTLMLLGPAITMLGLFEWARGPVARFFVIFGRVPLFYYLLHLPLIHGLAVVFDCLRYGWSPIAADGGWSVAANKDAPSDYGVNLAITYLVWVIVILLLYPLCRWFAGIKQRYRTAWLSYL